MAQLVSTAQNFVLKLLSSSSAILSVLRETVMDVQSQKGSAIFQSGSPSNISGCYFLKNYASQDGK